MADSEVSASPSAGRWRPLILVAHRWLGLASSIVLSIVGLTGAILAWPWSGWLRRPADRLHDSLALGRMGWRVVVIVTALAVLVQLTGLMLWWRRKSLRVNGRFGLGRAVSDLHHAIGAIALVLMLVTSASAVGRAVVRGPWRPVISQWHTTTGFPAPVKILFALGSLGFAVQSATGVVMWWRQRR